MRNAFNIASFEVATRLKRISTWVYFAVFFAIAIFWVAAAGGIIKSAVVSFGSGKVWINSPYAIAQTVSFLGMFGLSIIAAIMGGVAVGLRDYSHEEADFIARGRGRLTAFTDREIKNREYRGVSWEKTCDEILKALGKKVYVSFDIDALNPSLCPHTGTPVPGGLEFDQTFYLLKKLTESGRSIIGCDLCEVAPGKNDEWDAIVGMRALYRLCNFMARSC